MTGAEGATAPETLRQTDRERQPLWKAAIPEKDGLTDGENASFRVNLSGHGTEGAIAAPFGPQVVNLSGSVRRGRS